MDVKTLKRYKRNPGQIVIEIIFLSFHFGGRRSRICPFDPPFFHDGKQIFMPIIIMYPI